MVSVLTSSAVDRGFKVWSDQAKDYKIDICCFSAKYAALSRNNKDWLARNTDNVSDWGDMTTRQLLFQSPIRRVGLAQSGPHHHLIEN